MGATKNVDLVTIGAGGGAYPAAFRLAKAGRQVVMVDTKGVMSGNCLSEGCVPSKAVREMAQHLHRHQRFQNYGIRGGAVADYSAIVAHKNKVQEIRYAQHAKELEEAPLVTLVHGRARMLDAHTVLVETNSGEQRYSARSIIVASGTEVSIAPIPGAELCLTSTDLYKLHTDFTVQPRSMVIIGGGYIGLETATFFAAFGTKVTLLHRSEHVLTRMDAEMVETLTPLLDPGIEIVVRTKVLGVEKLNEGLQVRYQVGDTVKTVQAEQVILATGRHPVVPEGLSACDVEFTSAGYLVANEAMQTKAPHIYSCGDVNGKVLLFHAAVRQSLVAAHNILGGDVPCDYFDRAPVPTTVFTIPAAAYVGMTGAAAAKAGIRLVTGGYNFADDSRAQIMGEMEGGIRLFFEPESLRLVGGWVVGIDAGSLIGEIGLAVAGQLTAREIANFPDQHPMSAEGVSRAARSLF
ncbi:MAG: dihydrolipoyl dehydrogenase [Acidobacteriaceae bacterium]